MDGADTKERNEEWRNFLGKMLQYMASVTEVVEFGELCGAQEYKTGLIPKKEERRLGYGWGKQNILSAPPYIINKSAAAQTSYNNYLKDTKEMARQQECRGIAVVRIAVTMQKQHVDVKDKVRIIS